MKIIAFGHEKNIGKNTLARFLTSELRLQNRGINISSGGFADKFKKVCYDLYSWAGVQPGHYYEENLKAKNDFLPKLGMTVRQIWIKIGNKIREVYDETWIDYLIRNQSISNDLLVITDLRFPNEANRILHHGGYIFKIIRPSVKHTSDEADDALINYNKWTEEILNDKGLPELFEKAQYLIGKYFKDILNKGNPKEEDLNLKISKGSNLGITDNPKSEGSDLGITDNSNDPALNEVLADGQNKKYLILPDNPNSSIVRPLRFSYRHLLCGESTRMNEAIAKTYAQNPSFYTHTFCVNCRVHVKLFEDSEKKNHNFVWDEDNTPVGL